MSTAFLLQYCLGRLRWHAHEVRDAVTDCYVPLALSGFAIPQSTTYFVRYDTSNES